MATPDLSRRCLLKFAAAGSAATLPAVALASPDRSLVDPGKRSDAEFYSMFREWQRLFELDHSVLTDEESDEHIDRCLDMGEQIVLCSTSSEDRLAIQYHVATLGGTSQPSFLFEDKMDALFAKAVASC